MKTSVQTVSETYFEQWCRDNEIECRRIKDAYTPGYKRPDYAIKVEQRWCIVEIKQIDPTQNDDLLLQEAVHGQGNARWVEPGARLTGPIRDASDQLRKFSKRGFPTVVCFFDNTIGFYDEEFHIVQAMAGQETLSFEVSGNPEHKPRFLGMHFGKKSTLTKSQNTSVSAVAVLRRFSESAMVVDLYHNRFARVPISRDDATPYIRKQQIVGVDVVISDSPSIWDVINGSAWSDWLADPEGMCAKEIRKCIRELREKGEL